MIDRIKQFGTFLLRLNFSGLSSIFKALNNEVLMPVQEFTVYRKQFFVFEI